MPGYIIFVVFEPYCGDVILNSLTRTDSIRHQDCGAFLTRPDPFFQGTEKLFQIDGLGNMIVHAGVYTFFFVAGHGMAGHGDYWDPLEFGMGNAECGI